MRTAKLILLLSILSMPFSFVNAQTKNQEVNFEQLIEDVFANQKEAYNYEELYESLYQLYLNPIDLNHTNQEELLSTYLLSPLQVESFVDYVNKHGQLLCIYELQIVPNFDLRTIRSLLPFVTIREPFFISKDEKLIKKILREENKALLLRYERTLEEKKGFTSANIAADSTSAQPARYQGSPDKIYLRFRVSHTNDFSFGITAEKDAGEQLIWSPATKRFGADFWSFHLALKNKGHLKSLIIGEYQLQVAQGLLLGAGFAPGKGAETITTIRRPNLGIKPYTSIIESGYFRGLASTIRLNRLDLTTFYSQTNRDAIEKQADDSLVSEQAFVSALQVTGFHRTPNEIAAKATIRERTAGLNLNYRSPRHNLNLGLNALYTHFQVPIQKTPRVYNQFEFNGTENYNLGTYYSFTWQNFNLFGEAAISASKGVGLLSGLIVNLSRQWELSLLFRSYARNFHTFYGSAFSENSRNINERGIYTGIKYMPSSSLSFTAFFDQFKFPWLKYRVNAPSTGSEVLGRVNFTPNKKVLLYAQYRREGKSINTDEETNLKSLAKGLKQSYLLNLDFSVSKSVNIKSRVQFSTYELNKEQTEGFVIAQDLNFTIWKFKFSTRAALFDTDDYENRQYIYERDVLYAFSIPAYYGIGIRNYFLLQYDVLPNLNLWIRFARTRYRDKNIIGTGLETIEGNTKTDCKFQVDTGSDKLLRRL